MPVTVAARPRPVGPGPARRRARGTAGPGPQGLTGRRLGAPAGVPFSRHANLNTRMIILEFCGHWQLEQPGQRTTQARNVTLSLEDHDH